MCVVAWENLKRREILTFPMIYTSENFPQLKQFSSQVIAVAVEFAFKNLVPIWHRSIAGILTAGIEVQTELITHMLISLSHVTIQQLEHH